MSNAELAAGSESPETNLLEQLINDLSLSATEKLLSDLLKNRISNLTQAELLALLKKASTLHPSNFQEFQITDQIKIIAGNSNIPLAVDTTAYFQGILEQKPPGFSG